MYLFTVRTSLDLFIYREEVPGSVDVMLCENGDIWLVLTRAVALIGKKSSGRLPHSGDLQDL